MHDKKNGKLTNLKEKKEVILSLFFVNDNLVFIIVLIDGYRCVLMLNGSRKWTMR